MSESDQNIFEELISDTHFIAWVKGEDLSKAEYWNLWEKRHPLQVDEFREAVRLVQKLKFRGADVASGDISYSWAKISDKIKLNEPVSRFRYFLTQVTRIAAVLLLPVMLVSGWLIYNQRNLAEKYSNLLENKHEQKITVIAPIGARITVDLPDGSKAWLNSGSELTYPVVFNTSERHVSLTGEAFFKVQKDETPFFVSNLGPEVKVYGTEFNVNSYANEELVTVALAEGKVSLSSEGKEQFITPGQVSVFSKQSKKMTIENTDVVTYSSWREGKFIFRKTSLSSILRILQRQHNVNIQLMNPELGNYRYNMTINNESLDQILQLLSISAPIKYTYNRKELKSDGTYLPDNIEISADKTRIIKN